MVQAMANFASAAERKSIDASNDRLAEVFDEIKNVLPAMRYIPCPLTASCSQARQSSAPAMKAFSARAGKK